MAANLFVPVTCNPRFHNVSRLAALTGSEMTTFGNGPRCAARVGENAAMTSSRGHGIRISSDTGSPGELCARSIRGKPPTAPTSDVDAIAKVQWPHEMVGGASSPE